MSSKNRSVRGFSARYLSIWPKTQYLSHLLHTVTLQARINLKNMCRKATLQAKFVDDDIWIHERELCHFLFITQGSQSTYTCRAQSCVWRLPYYWPPTPSPTSECFIPRTLAGLWGGWGVNILEDARQRIGLWQYNLSTIGLLQANHQGSTSEDTSAPIQKQNLKNVLRNIFKKIKGRLAEY
jgi:hypothetical protein